MGTLGRRFLFSGQQELLSVCLSVCLLVLSNLVFLRYWNILDTQIGDIGCTEYVPDGSA